MIAIDTNVLVRAKSAGTSRSVIADNDNDKRRSAPNQVDLRQ